MNRLHAPKPLPVVEQADANVFFEGWWNGAAIGFVIGAGATVLFIKSFLGWI